MLERVVAADRAEVAKLKAGPRPQEIEQARAQKAAAEAAVATIEQRIGDATVLGAPRRGRSPRAPPSQARCCRTASAALHPHRHRPPVAQRLRRRAFPLAMSASATQ